MGSDNTVRIRDFMQFVYKEMTLEGAKSNLAKWNLIALGCTSNNSNAECV